MNKNLQKKFKKSKVNKTFIIKDQIYLEKQKAYTDAEFYKISKEIEANNKKLTPEYLKYVALVNLSNNTKFYFGESIPRYISSNILNDSRNSK